MLKHPKMVTGVEVITNLDDKCIQPNAVDIRITAIERILDTPFAVGEDIKLVRKNKPVKLVSGGLNLGAKEQVKMWKLEPGSYQFLTNHFVNLPEGYAGWIVPRSTLNRNGVFITSGLYDSGFNNYIGGVIHVMCGTAYIQENARVGQFVLVSADTYNLYQGQYNA